MRRSLPWLALLVAICLALPVAAAENRLSLPGVEGGSLTGQDLASRDTILVVWTSWSPKCRNLPQQLAQLRKEWGGKVRILSVNFQEPADTVREYLKRNSLGVPTFLDSDGSFGKREAVTTLPGLLVYRGGERVFRGSLDPDSGRALTSVFGD